MARLVNAQKLKEVSQTIDNVSDTSRIKKYLHQQLKMYQRLYILNQKKWHYGKFIMNTF